MASLEYTRPYLYPLQQKAIFTPKRWSLCEASTKSGKTVASIARIIEWSLLGNGLTPAAPGQHYWWVAPVSSQAEIAYERIKLNLTKGAFEPKSSPTPHIFMPTGAIIDFKSADKPDSLYGEDVYGVIVDEGSRCRADAWYAVRSTLTATNGPGVVIGNVKGRKNWFFEWCRRAEKGLDPNAEFNRITWRDAVAAGVLNIEEIEDAQRNLPENVFRELYEAMASDDGANPFGEDHILACIALDSAGNPRKKPFESKPVAFGIDLAKKQDYLVVIGLDELGRVCAFQRWNHIPWPDSIRMIHEIVGEDVPALVDSTGIGDPVLDELKVEHGNFKGYNFSPASKQRLMEGLAVSIQSHEILFPDGVIKDELMSFEYVTGRTGVQYSAPEGHNDDCVMALGLARQCWAATQPAANLMEYFSNEARRAKREQERKDLKENAENAGTQFGEEFVAELDGLLGREERDFNELTQIYNETMMQYQRAEQKCFKCGGALAHGSRTSDGVNVWHEECLR